MSYSCYHQHDTMMGDEGNLAAGELMELQGITICET